MSGENKNKTGMPLEEAKKYTMVAISEYAKDYCGGVTPQAISHAIGTDKIDFVWLGKERMVVLTKKTKEYTPNSHPNRGASGGKVERK